MVLFMISLAFSGVGTGLLAAESPQPWAANAAVTTKAATNERKLMRIRNPFRWRENGNLLGCESPIAAQRHTVIRGDGLLPSSLCHAGTNATGAAIEHEDLAGVV